MQIRQHFLFKSLSLDDVATWKIKSSCKVLDVLMESLALRLLECAVFERVSISDFVAAHICVTDCQAVSKCIT